MESETIEGGASLLDEATGAEIITGDEKLSGWVALTFPELGVTSIK